MNKMDETLYSKICKEILEEFPSFKLVRKSDSTLCVIIDFFLFVVTLGKNDSFMTSYTTTIGTTVYIPTSWNLMSEARKTVILRHERVHMRQKERYGAFLFSFLYLFVPLPFLFSYFRMKFEKEAYEETIRAQKEYYGKDFLLLPNVRESMIRRFTGPDYFWTWVLRSNIEKWYDERVGE